MDNRGLKIEFKSVNELSPKLARLIQRNHNREFGNDPMVYAHPEVYILGYLSGELTTQVGVMRRAITVRQKPLLIGGVCFLITEPKNRGRGFASIAMKEAAAFLKNEFGLPFGLLTCKPRLESLYTGMGWQTVAGPSVFVQPTGIRSCGGLTMIFQCGEATWPEGEINLCGLPW